MQGIGGNIGLYLQISFYYSQLNLLRLDLNCIFFVSVAVFRQLFHFMARNVNVALLDPVSL